MHQCAKSEMNWIQDDRLAAIFFAEFGRNTESRKTVCQKPSGLQWL